MSNTKMILGIAAGVAALAVVGIILKKRGHLDGIISKAEEFSGDLADKYSNIKESARKKFDEVVEKGGEIADKITSHTDKAADTAKTTPTARA
jgi:hypothetical protein